MGPFTLTTLEHNQKYNQPQPPSDKYSFEQTKELEIRPKYNQILPMQVFSPSSGPMNETIQSRDTQPPLQFTFSFAYRLSLETCDLMGKEGPFSFT